jgi:hypothetical protein
MLRSKCGNTKSNISIYNTYKKVPHVWNELASNKEELLLDVLGIYEQSEIPFVNYRYAILYENNVAVAIAYFQLLSFNSSFIRNTNDATYSSKAISILLDTFKPKLLVSGHLFRHDQQAFTTLEETPDLVAFRRYEALIHQVRKESCALAILMKDTPDRFITHVAHFAPQFKLLRKDISMEMPIASHWKSLEDYEKALKHKYAQKMRKVRNQFSTIEKKSMTVADCFTYKNEIFSLYQEVSKNQRINLGSLSATYIPLLKQQYPDTFEVIGFWHNGVLVAFMSAWIKDDQLDMFYIGFKYELNAKFSLYFNILYESIALAILHNKHHLILGRTALEAKARLGCNPRYLSTYLYINSAYLRFFISNKLDAQLNSEGSEWELRHPFKE